MMSVVKTRILGTFTRSKQWKMHLSKNNDSVLKVSLSNMKTRKFMLEISVLIDYIFQHPEEAEKRAIWHEMIKKYTDAMEILLMRSEYTDQHNIELQEKIDFFLKHTWRNQEPVRRELQTTYICWHLDTSNTT